MKKIPTLFPKNKKNLKLVVDDKPIIDLNDNNIEFYIKLDGQACAIINRKLYTRYDAKLFRKKRGKIIKRYTIEEIKKRLPVGAIECQKPDQKSGHYPHWIPIDEKNKTHQYILEGYNNALKLLGKLEDGTYEILGPKFVSNKHGLKEHFLFPHKHEIINFTKNIDKNEMLKNPYEYFKNLMNNLPYEGLVIYKEGIPVSKIRRSDYDLDIAEYENIVEKLKRNE